MKTWMLGWTLMFLLLQHAQPTQVENRAGCSTAAMDLVYILDGSSSVGVSDFDTAKRWLINVTSSFLVGPQYTRAAVVQYSDTPRLEVPLGLHQSAQDLIRAIGAISYLGGNTQSGRAIRFASEHVFPPPSSASSPRPARHRIAVVVTDGKSQDDVVDAALEARAQNIVLFAVGVGSEVASSELVSFANRPSSAYVLYAKDYTTIGHILGAMQQKLCEESVCPAQIPVGSKHEKGFELISGMRIDRKAAKVPGSLESEGAYMLSHAVDITESTRGVFPEGLPPAYVFVATLRLKEPTDREAFDLWRILSRDGTTQVAVTLDGKSGSVAFSTTSTKSQLQSARFSEGAIKRLFDGDWHHLKLQVQPRGVACFLDNVLVAERLLDQVMPIYINGRTQVAKATRTGVSVPIEVQKLRLYCDPQQVEREAACEIVSVVSLPVPCRPSPQCGALSLPPRVSRPPWPSGAHGPPWTEGPRRPPRP
uniref:Si:ch211-106n13.3 n=1 Tax=Paramormyrops kingsleyae TaxID=1676925 RepID=A0A3B3RAX3_9TELE